MFVPGFWSDIGASAVETLFGELKRYVSFGPADEDALRAFHPLAASEFPRIAEVFYDHILNHEEARRALEGGESKVGRLKVTLVSWMHKLFQGPWDEEYFELRCRIGRVHVRIALPQHYMFGAMNVIRRELGSLVARHYAGQPRELDAAQTAVDKMLDLELAMMLHTYREDLVAQQERIERLSTFGQLAGTIGHELRNPLGVIESSLYILKGRLTDDERTTKHLNRIGEQLAISNQIINTLLDLIRDRPLSREQVPLAEVVAGAREAVPLPDGVRLTVSGLEELPEVAGDPAQLRQVFVNLLENAVHAVDGAGEIRVAGARRDGMAEVAVEDTGPGVDPSIGRRLFEPLVTTKTKGIGLGLALVRRILERHEGTVAYERAAGRGARFVVRLPAGGPRA
jgi:two-component system, NtrC family, sensor histidine kinase HydH